MRGFLTSHHGQSLLTRIRANRGRVAMRDGIVEEGSMGDRRNFLKTLAGATAGMALAGPGVLGATAARAAQAAQAAGGRREVSVGGKRAKVIDSHAHCVFPGVADVVKGTPLEGKIGATGPQVQIGPPRLKAIDERG